MISSDVASLVEKALARREALIARNDLDCYRLFHDQADGVPGLVVERFGPVLIAQLHEERLRMSPADVRAVAELFHERLGTRAVYRKSFVKDRARPSAEIEQQHHSPSPWIGQPVEPEIAVAENGLHFLIRPYDGFSTGLFLEHRDNRARVRQLAQGKSVLNTFSYTCAFSVAAAAGGATRVDSVDVFKRYLEWGKSNFAANGFTISAEPAVPHGQITNKTPVPHLFFCSDVLDFYKRAERQGRSYDLVILDPPTFARLRRPYRPFVLDEQLESLCSGAVRLLKPGGLLFLATNHRGISRSRLESALQSTGAVHPVEHLPLPADFAGDLDYSKSILARLDD